MLLCVSGVSVGRRAYIDLPAYAFFLKTFLLFFLIQINWQHSLMESLLLGSPVGL